MPCAEIYMNDGSCHNCQYIDHNPQKVECET